MLPRRDALHHPAAPLLLEYATHGCPVDCGPDWTPNTLNTAIHRGAHPSAQDPAAAAACRKEALERVADSCCRIINWNDIRDNPPHNLKISPIAAIPHKSRDFRMILDLSFIINNADNLHAVNDASDKTLAPQHAMFELGNVIPRIVHTMATTSDHTTPFSFAKIDLKDGYWRMSVHPRDAYNFAYVLPTPNANEPPQLVIPEALQMGWSESPPFFCAATETARDIAQSVLMRAHPPAHPLEHVMLNHQQPTQYAPQFDPTACTLIEVYIDDFILITQSTNKPHLLHVARTALHAIDDIFPGPDITGSTMQPPISYKKLQEEGVWATTNEILGWQFDGTHRTIQLPPHKADLLLKMIKDIRRKKQLPFKDFQKLHGKLQFLTVALPLGKPFMGPLDTVIATAAAQNRTYIRITDTLRQHLHEWSSLTRLLKSRPTHVCELIEHNPGYRGFVDASRWGVGGVWFSGHHLVPPTVWFLKWPPRIQDLLTTASNPNGTLSISDLELAGIVLHFLVLEALATHSKSPLHHVSPAFWCDNLAAVSWTYKARTSTSTAATRLLCALAIRLHANRCALPITNHITGSYNVMADVASRKHTTDPTRFLTFFTQSFPPPQESYWTLFQFTDDTPSKLYSALLQPTSTMESWKQHKGTVGVFGRLGRTGSLQPSPTYPHTSPTSRKRTASVYWLPSPSMCDKAAFTSTSTKFAPKQSKWRSPPSPRSSNWMDNKARWEQRKQGTQRPSNSFWMDTPTKTHRPNQNSPSPLQSHVTYT